MTGRDAPAAVNWMKTTAAGRRKRQQQVRAARAELLKARRERRADYKAREARGEVVEKLEPATIQAHRKLQDDVVDETLEEFEEVVEAEADDEFAPLLSQPTAAPAFAPKLLITTVEVGVSTNRRFGDFLKELQVVFPELYYVDRARFPLAEDLLAFAKEREFTDLLILERKLNEPYGLIVSHLPEGPTMHFRLSGIKYASDFPANVTTSTHTPELVLKNFSTALARRVERQLRSLFPINPEFVGRRVVSFINKHDFIFFRHYRYIFAGEGTRVNLVEIGPKFTLKIRSVQEGVLDRECGKYEFFWRPKLQETHLDHHL